ncbi:PEP-utilizing enzyme [Jatrophihabitans fulvus]
MELPTRWITDWEPYDRFPVITRANAGEVLPDPASPLGWTLVFEKGLLPGWLRGLVEFGVYREGELPMEKPPVVGTAGGYFYINLSHCRVMGLRMGMTTEAFDAAILGNAAAAPPYRPHPEDIDEECQAKLGASIGAMIGATEFPEIDADLARILEKRRARPELATLTDADLVAYARTLLPELDNAFRIHDFSTLSSAAPPAMLAESCAAAGRPDALLDLISGLGEVRSASPSWGLWQLSRLAAGDADLTKTFDAGVPAVSSALAGGSHPEFADALRDFLAEHGQRGPNEWDIHAISWEADPTQVLALVDSMRHLPDDNSPDARNARLEATRRETAEAVRAALPDDTARATFDVAMGAATRLIPLREKTKLVNVTAVNEVRMAIRELGRRGVEAGLYEAAEDVMMLLESELDDYVADPKAFAATIAERLVTYRALYELEPPFIIDGHAAPLPEWERREAVLQDAATAGTVLQGVGGGAGTYTGVARVVTDLDGAMQIEPGEVLIAPLTDAAWTPLFLVAGAVAVDVGALNSHAVVVSRELGLPCVISLDDATEKLRSGMTVTVDGNAGTVTVVETA